MTRCFQVPNQRFLFWIVKFLMEYNSKVPTHCLVLSHLIAPHCGTFNFICKSCRKCRSDEGLLSSFAALTDDTWETCLANQIGLYLCSMITKGANSYLFSLTSFSMFNFMSFFFLAPIIFVRRYQFSPYFCSGLLALLISD